MSITGIFESTYSGRTRPAAGVKVDLVLTASYKYTANVALSLPENIRRYVPDQIVSSSESKTFVIRKILNQLNRQKVLGI